MKKKLFVLLTGISLFSLTSEAKAEYFEINRMQTDVAVHENGTMAVGEMINLTFKEPRHGIYRDIDTQGIKIKVTGVENQDGKPWNYALENFDRGTRVKIGDADKFVDGLQAYQINYDVTKGGIRFFDDHDELYWNATGTEWPVGIGEAGAVIRLPDGIDEKDIKLACYTGAFGSDAEKCSGEIINGVVTFQATAPLSAYEGLTVVVGFPKGVIVLPPPPKWLPFLMLFLTLLALGIALEPLYGYIRRGRDPRGKGTIFAQYDPPDKLIPAEMGTLLDEKADMRDITSTIIDLAVHGYLAIKEIPDTKSWIFKKTDYELARTEPKLKNAHPLSPFEEKLMQNVFGGAKVINISDLEQKFYTHVPGLKTTLYENLVQRGYFPKSPEKVRANHLVKGIVLTFIGFSAPGFELATFGTAFSFCLLINGILSLVFAWFMPRKTEEGKLAHEHVLGFKLYLNTAEKDRLRFQENENLFYEFLPYAMTLGIAKQWGEKFKGLYKNAPDWYEGSGPFSMPVFVGRLENAASRMQNAFASQPPHSSGGSGFSGGFSGGGGGGGG
ncbi:DUF2207 domain-containing protein, partial [Candidatus Peregrinibacteria bacterium]|nr:DUF2207 domain-containing protein [Candidatus Peregrinibacteria bacterium]